MGFWANVEKEMEYQGISRKELAYKANISYSGIGLGLERDSMPGADTALSIAKTLHVSIEYLLYGTVAPENADKTIIAEKYKSITAELESLPPEVRAPVIEMIHKLSLAYRKNSA
ncbi:MAG: helix-turn-helix transcriptional regulator [Treponema sp.]|nr:helix-turn-helix transcriptional regulator [Treponema sp.]MBD5443127.1 helix-turn-helix transcriptional regulator [Treponema sp.]